MCSSFSLHTSSSMREYRVVVHRREHFRLPDLPLDFQTLCLVLRLISCDCGLSRQLSWLSRLQEIAQALRQVDRTVISSKGEASGGILSGKRRRVFHFCFLFSHNLRSHLCSAFKSHFCFSFSQDFLIGLQLHSNFPIHTCFMPIADIENSRPIASHTIQKDKFVAALESWGENTTTIDCRRTRILYP